MNPMVDSREGFDVDWQEYEAYLDGLDSQDDVWYDDDEDDGQPSEYDEWQDVFGGDDWDQGQYYEAF